VPVVASSDDGPLPALSGDPDTSQGRWVGLTEHLADVRDAVRALAAGLSLPRVVQQALETAAVWHDVGKAHPVFQAMLTAPGQSEPGLAPPGEGLWAKSNHRKGRASRRYFRHELASTLAL